MMFYKLLCYDLKNGFLSTYKRYLSAAVAFVIMFVSFQLVAYSYNTMEKPDVPIAGSLGDVLIYAFGGMYEYVPSKGAPFTIPAFWLLTYLLLAYITLYYPFEDLEEFGQNILIRSKGRMMWWFSKCAWILISVVCYFLLAWAVMAIGCLITGGPLNMELSPNIPLLCSIQIEYQMPQTMIPQMLVLPLLVMIGLNLLQMTLSLIFKPFYSFIVTATILLISTYYLSPACIGNYAMPFRSHLLLSNGVGLNTGMLISAIIIVVSVAVGGLIFRKRDILKGEGEA